MKMPKLKDLRIDEEGTRKIRAAMAKVKKVKITVNIDEETIFKLKKRSEETGIPYQNLLNRLLKEILNRSDSKHTYEYRLSRLEKEISQLRKKKPA
ncbi:MAG: hypothetical protein V4596_09855 [Bdellovibrionota bacterium]